MNPVFDEHAEQAVLGTVLMVPAALPNLLAVEELRPEHFYRPRHQKVFAAIVDLHSRSEAVDSVTVAAELRARGELDDVGGEGFVHALQTHVPSVDADRSHARLVIGDAWFRAQLEAGQELAAAAGARDRDGVAAAQGRLGAAARQNVRRPSRTQRQSAVLDIVEGRGKRWASPFARLDDLLAGGWRPGQLTTIAGHASHGKSALLAQLLGHGRGQGARCALYTNEMEPEELDVREVARVSGIPYWRLVQGKLRDGEHEKALQGLQAVGETFEVVEAAGMTADEIAYDIRRERWDLCGVDLLNGLPKASDTRDIDANIATLAACSRQSSSHIFCCNHLNQARSVGHGYPPEPVPADIRGSGAIYNLSNNVLFVYLAESDAEPGEPGTDAALRLAKARGGIRGRVDAVFQPKRMRFLPAMGTLPGTVGVAA